MAPTSASPGFPPSVAIVTGAASGIGAAVARRLAASGTRVCLADVSADALDAVARDIGPTATACVTDVTDEDSCRSAVRATRKAFGHPADILVNAAGVSLNRATTEMTLAEWNRVFAVNVTGPFLLTRHALPGMIERGRGSIVNVASLAAHRSLPETAAYSASKAALIAFTRQMAADYGRHGIRANSVSPGATATPMLLSEARAAAEAAGIELETFLEKASAELPLRRIGRGEDVAEVCAFLAGDASTSVTGVDILVDSGTAGLDAFALAMTRLASP
ncbi:SDR family oxidoreductase [Microbacterium sp. NPDC086615]|jgi:NAD(P)-dependent dehydrogenase (short-subunit alcohol dehydrogenase family)|uniref:SDR family NAD(P)-dependent oxidoreductase n=1 Tax=Microbacterium sp. NPDC086615 TaxID=3154865 RepID=UPI00342F1976|nr:short-chain dehydrogenase/reductase [Microbacterium sp.]